MSEKAPTTAQLRERAKAKLAEAWEYTGQGPAPDSNGYLPTWKDHLLPGVVPSMFEHDLTGGRGNELVDKFRACHSSAALAVNTFARWKANLGELEIAGQGGFTGMTFEAQCRMFVGQKAPPNLDVVLEATHDVVAIESKLTEPLGHGAAEFGKTYDTLPVPAGCARWHGLIEILRQDPKRFKLVDAAQLVKHSFGLCHSFPGRWVTLLYLYWEPANADAYDVYRRHRDEVEELTALVVGDAVRFRAQSYVDLWRSWSGRIQPPWLPSHLGHLLDRYHVAI